MKSFYGETLSSPLMLGTALYPSPAVLREAFTRSGASVATVSVRREAGSKAAGADFWAMVRELGVRVLPNTAGCHSVREAVTTAQMARELFGTDWIKLEVIGHPDTLQPDPFALLEAARILCAEGFKVFPYTTEDLVLAERLLKAGCDVLMPWGAPIGTGLGLTNPYGLRTLRAQLPDVPLVVDAGLGLPSHAAQAMEMGFDAVLLNTAVARAGDPPAMAEAFALAVKAGCLAHDADPMDPRDMASPSTPMIGKAFLA
jgi:thiazole synthase